jgi:hypothetical protein
MVNKAPLNHTDKHGQRIPTTQARRQPSEHHPNLMRQAIETPDHSSLTPAVVLALQATYGNQFTQRLINRMTSHPTEDQPSSKAASISTQTTATTQPIQRAILQNELEMALLDNIGMPPLTNQNPRNYHETKLLIAEFQLRYPNGAPANLINAVRVNLNQNAVNNQAMIRAAISQEEANLLMPLTTPNPPAPVNNHAVFVQDLIARQGSYTWAGGTSVDFRNWLAVLNPLANPPAVNVTINCWEAILISAALAGLITIQDLQQDYAQPLSMVDTALYNRLIQGGTTAYQHPALNPQNNIQAGDIILIDGADGPLTHVVAVIAPDTNNYTAIRVMSLWTARAMGTAGGSLTNVDLGTALAVNSRFRSIRL